MTSASVSNSLAVIREAVEVLRHKHTKKACAKQGSFVCIGDLDAKKLANDLELAALHLQRTIEAPVKS